MRKTFFALSMAAALACPPLLAAAAELTPQQKYEALAAAGIFTGIDGQSALDQNLTRAQFAHIAALITGLDSAPPAAPTYSDVPDSHWAAGPIAALSGAGLIDGSGDGKFNPRDNTSIEQLATVMAKALGLGAVPDAQVDGASDWAQGYIAAAIAAGLIPAQDDYTAPASRELLQLASYKVQPDVHVPTQAEIAAKVISDAVKANPGQADSIVADAIKTDPSQAALIVKAAITAAPDQAEAITRAALAADPTQRDAIIQAATEAAPEQADAIQAIAAAADESPDAVETARTTAVANDSSIPGASAGSGGGGNGDDVASPSTPSGPNDILP